MVAGMITVVIKDIEGDTVTARCSACEAEWPVEFENMERGADGAVTAEEQALLRELLNGDHECPKDAR